MDDSYQEILKEVCQIALDPQELSQSTFKNILKDIHKSQTQNRYKKFERAWMLRILYERLARASRNTPPRHDPTQESFLEGLNGSEERLEQLKKFLMRLPLEQRVLLILKDRYSIPLNDISLALGIPEESLKLSRSQAIERLSKWIWDN